MTVCEQSLSHAPSDLWKWMERAGRYQRRYQMPSESGGQTPTLLDRFR